MYILAWVWTKFINKIQQQIRQLYVIQILLQLIDLIIIAINTLMYNSYRKSGDADKYNENDIPTATKTNYIDTSPYCNNTSALKSPNRVMSKIQGVRDSIGSMINEISHKKNQNAQAVLRVKNVNAEAMNVLRQEDQYQTYTPKKSDRANPRQNRTIGGAPDYDNVPQQGFSSEFNLFGDNVPQFKSLQQENFELRKALSEQVRVNNDLIARIRFLQAQNHDLKTQLGHVDPSKMLRSTRYNSVSYDDTNNEFAPLSPVQPKYQPASPRIISDGFISSPYLAHDVNRNTYNANSGNYGASNSFGQGNFYGANSGTNYGSASFNTPNWNVHNPESHALLSDLDHLKRQNEALRQNTLSMLRNH